MSRTVSHPVPLFTHCVPSPFAGIEAVEAETRRRNLSPERIEHADAELLAGFAECDEPRFDQDYDAFPAWEPSGDDLDAMCAAWLARESERGESVA